MAGVVKLRCAPCVRCVEVFDQHRDAGVVEQEAPLVSDAQIQQVAHHTLQRSAVTDDQNLFVAMLMNRQDLIGDLADALPSVHQGFTARELDAFPRVQVLPHLEELGIVFPDLRPRDVFVVAEIVFPQLRTSLDLDFRTMGRDRFRGLERPPQVAGVNGAEFDVRQSFRHRFCLDFASFRERRVEMPLGFVVQVSLGFAMSNEVDGARRWVEYAW